MDATHSLSVGLIRPNVTGQQTRDIEPLLVHCWASVVNGGPTLNQQWPNVSCLLGGLLAFLAILTAGVDEVLFCSKCRLVIIIIGVSSS